MKGECHIKAIRGAITTENTREQIFLDTITLINEILNVNKIKINDIVSIIFSATKDINEAYPAEAVRSMGIDSIPMMCFQEMYVKDSLQKCIRVIVFLNCDNSKEIIHVYLKDAKKLRPDLVQGGVL